MNRHPFLILLAVAVFLLLLPGLVGTCFASKRVALVIGNGAYQAAPLKNPVNDARDMAAALQQLDFEVITALNASKREMITSIDRFAAKLRRSEIGLFYYAGHGMQINGRNYLIPVKVAVQSESDVEFESVDAGRVLGKMKHADNKLNVVVLDACRNNPFARSFRSGEQGLARMDAPVGTIIAYATGPGAVAADGSGRNGIFTKHLLTTIHTPNLSIQEIFNEAGMGVMRDTGNKQVPWTSNTPIPRYYLAGGSFVVETPVKGASLGEKAKKEAVGTIRVKSTPPGATLYIDDQDSGTTPVTLSGLPAESTNIRVELAGYTAEEKQVQIRSGKKSTVSFVLSPLARKGWLTVTTEPPEAKVRILNIGPRYRSGMELDPGRYQVEVSASGYERVVRRVELSAGESLDMDIALERLASPSGAGNYIDPTTGLEFVFVKGGCYQMGDTFADGYKDEKPVHEVCVNDFYIGRYEVTQGEYQQMMSFNPSHFTRGDRYPVENVGWDDAQVFIRKLNRRSGKKYRLPTEAEWEYAAREGGKKVRFGTGNNIIGPDEANFDASPKHKKSYSRSGKYRKATVAVGSFNPNALGLYDMSGNVWEWCQDRYDADYYESSPKMDPTGPSFGSYHTSRGGGWIDLPRNVRSVTRNRNWPDYRNGALGFRLVFQAQ